MHCFGSMVKINTKDKKMEELASCYKKVEIETNVEGARRIVAPDATK